jgi:hypothetical protein
MLVLQRQIIKNPTPTLTLPLKWREFYGVFPLHGGDFIGFSHFHGSFSNSSPFKGEVSPAPRRVQDKALNLTWFRGGGWGIYVAVVLKGS